MLCCLVLVKIITHFHKLKLKIEICKLIFVIITGTLLIPGGIPCLIEIITNLGLSTPVLFAGKTLIAFPATFHTFNGLRHLVIKFLKFTVCTFVYSY